jgi:predicted nucleic acid-binding protein
VLTARAIGPGEREALALALEHGGATLVVDERRARRIAERLAVPIVGTAGLLVAAKRAGLIDAVSPVLDRLRHDGFFLDDEIVRLTLTEAGK